MRIRTTKKLTLAFTVIFVLMILMGIGAYVSLLEIGEGAERVREYEHRFFLIEDVRRSLLVLRSANDAVLTGSQESFDHFQLLVTEIKGKIATIEKLSVVARQRETIEEINKSFDRIVYKTNEIAGLPDTINHPQAKRLIKEVNEAGASLVNLMGHVSRNAQTDFNNVLKKADQVKERTKVLIITFSLVSVLFVLGSGIVLARGVSRSIKSLFAASLAISKGDLSQRVDIKSQDEFGALAATFNKMVGDKNRFIQREKALRKAAIITADVQREKAEQLKKAYQELKETQTRLVQSEKLAVLGQLASGVAHEINNPLTAISIEAEMLCRDEDKDQDTKRASKVILEQSKRVQVIIERLSAFSHKREHAHKLLNIKDALEATFSLLSYEPKIKNIKILKELSVHLPEVLGDSNQLQEVFLNIMLNAVQAMGGKGELSIRTRTEKVAERNRRTMDRFQLGQEVVVVEFEDTGGGIDEETQKKIFDPFFTTKEKGTGLGLSICRGIIESHKGVIEINSRIGEGTTFIVKLPIKKRGDE